MSKCFASAVIATAKSQVGYKEKASKSNLDSPTANAGSANWTKYARDFDEKYTGFYNGKKNGFAWCDMFVDWCFVTTFGVSEALRLLCQPTGSAGAGCTYSLAYYKKQGRLHTKPQPGDQIFFGSSQSDVGHTGLVYAVDNANVYTIEGNSSDQVAYRSYPLNSAKIVGYGRPAYDAENSATANANAPATTQPASGANAAQGLSVGAVATFTGSVHYASANAESGKPCKPGAARVTSIYKTGKHPVHLIHADGNSTVYGWVDEADISTSGSGSIVNGATVKVKDGAKTYTGGSLASFVYSGTYFVMELVGDRAVIGKSGAVTAAVNVKDLILVK